MKLDSLKIYSPYLIAFLPIGFYFYLLNRYAVNIPYYDDHALKAFILNYEKATTFAEKIQTLFQQHNEHRIVFTRFLTLIIYWIKGTIDYTWLIWLGNLTLVGILYFFYKMLNPITFDNELKTIKSQSKTLNSELRTLNFLPLSFLLFTQMLWENTYWGMASVQNFGVLFFVIGLFYFLTNNASKDFNRAILFAVLATFTSGNGFLALPIAIFILILQKQNKRATIFTAISALLAFVYFYQYKSPENPAFHGAVKDYFKAFLAFLGNVADFQPAHPSRIKYLMLVGSVFLVLSILYGLKLLIQSPIFASKNALSFSRNPLSTPSKFGQDLPIDASSMTKGQTTPWSVSSQTTNPTKNLFYLGIISFLIASALIVSVGRLGFGLEVMLTSRYKIYSILLLMCLYALLIQWTAFQQKLLPLCIFGALIFNILMNWQYVEESIYQRNRLLSFDFTGGFPDFSGVRKIDPKVPYSPKKQFYDGHFQEIITKLKDSTLLAKNIKVTHTQKALLLESTNNPFENKSDIFVSLLSEKRMYLFPTRQNRQSSKDFFLKNGVYFAEGFKAIIGFDELDSGKYQLGIVNTTDSKAIPLKSEITIGNTNNKIKVNW